MSVYIRTVQGAIDLKTFIYLPAAIHADHPNWMPPLYMDEKAYFDPAKNKSFSYCDTVLFLAYKDDKPRGRIMGIIHHPYNAEHQEKTVRFAHLDCYDDEDVCHALLNAVEQWGREKGMTRIIGPFGFSGREPQGLLVEGFDKPPIMVTICNLPYLPVFVERNGYVKELDCMDYLIDINKDIPEIYPRIFERVRRNTQFRLLEFHKTSEMKPYIIPIFELINRTYAGLHGFSPLDDQEMREMAARYLPILDPRFLKVVLDESDKVIAFMLGIPNMTKGIQRAKGRLYPFGFIHILLEAKMAKQLDLLLGAIDVPYRGRGLDILMGWKMIESARKAGIHTFETNVVLETNTAMRAEYERLGAKLYKVFRIYQKDLNR
jgi:ribosomal protein S18 acetylase RimI-like enzyme